MVRFDPNVWTANTVDPWRRRVRAVIRWVRLPWDLGAMAIWWWRARRFRDSKWVDKTTGTL